MLIELVSFSGYYVGEYMKKIIFLLLFLIPMNVKAYGTLAKSVTLMDMDSHRIIYGKNINYVQSVASISKIMTT